MLPDRWRGRTLAIVFWVLGSVLAPGGVSGAEVQPPPPPQQPATVPVHGLTGYYYTSAPAHGARSPWYSVDEYWLPTPNKPPDGVRVDPQIAFGRDTSFLGGTNDVPAHIDFDCLQNNIELDGEPVLAAGEFVDPTMRHDQAKAA